jgi:hypothetical protein
MSTMSLSRFADSLAALRQALADADPLAASPLAVLFSTTAETVASAFASAPEANRRRFLLRALDDAIAAIEVAARLADELHGTEGGRGGAEGEENALQQAYRDFARSQTTYQALYQYRNVLAAQLRLEARPIPTTVDPAQAQKTVGAVEATAAMAATAATAHDERTQPRSRQRSHKQAARAKR